jgi:hypothetical protein
MLKTRQLFILLIIPKRNLFCSHNGNVYIKAAEKALEKDLFYYKPAKHAASRKPWYYHSAVVHSTLKKKIKDMFNSAGLDGSSISNRNLRATGVSRMYSKGIREKYKKWSSQHFRCSII